MSRLDDYITESIEDKGIFKAICMAGQPAAGKAQPLYSKILTLNSGWKNMGSIVIGDILISPTGNTTKVTHIHPQGMKDIYRLYFQDGRFVDATEDHLWICHGIRMKKESERKRSVYIWGLSTTKEIKETIERKTIDKREVSIPLVNPIKYNKNDKLIINPYLMGVLLGDGCFRGGISITTNDLEIFDYIKLKNPLHFVKSGKNCFFIRENGKGNKNSYIEILKNLNLYNKKSIEKFIPEIYKTSSIDERISIIQGLMDTDGYSSKTGYIEYYTISERLAFDFMEIIRSLGDNVSYKIKKTYYKKNDIKIECNDIYIIRIWSHNPEKYFKLKRKKNRTENQNLQKRNLNNKLKSKIINVEKIGKDYCQCITVDKEDGLYITDNFIVTHNSYVFSKIKSGNIEPRIVNIDTWIEYFHTTYGNDKTKKLTAAQLYQFINSMLPLFIDATSTDPAALVVRYNILDHIGYDVGMVFVNTTLETSIERVEKRNKEGKRVVDIDVVKDSYEKMEKIKDFLKGKFSFFVEVNNDDDKLTDEVVLKAFKRTLSFYTSPVQNIAGDRIIELMKKKGWKYLVPNIYDDGYLKSLVNRWFRSTR